MLFKFWWLDTLSAPLCFFVNRSILFLLSLINLYEMYPSLFYCYLWNLIKVNEYVEIFFVRTCSKLEQAFICPLIGYIGHTLSSLRDRTSPGSCWCWFVAIACHQINAPKIVLWTLAVEQNAHGYPIDRNYSAI